MLDKVNLVDSVLLKVTAFSNVIVEFLGDADQVEDAVNRVIILITTKINEKLKFLADAMRTIVAKADEVQARIAERAGCYVRR